MKLRGNERQWKLSSLPLKRELNRFSYLVNDYQRRKSNSGRFLSYDGEGTVWETIMHQK